MRNAAGPILHSALFISHFSLSPTADPQQPRCWPPKHDPPPEFCPCTDRPSRFCCWCSWWGRCSCTSGRSGSGTWSLWQRNWTYRWDTRGARSRLRNGISTPTCRAHRIGQWPRPGQPHGLGLPSERLPAEATGLPCRARMKRNFLPPSNTSTPTPGCRPMKRGGIGFRLALGGLKTHPTRLGRLKTGPTARGGLKALLTTLGPTPSATAHPARRRRRAPLPRLARVGRPGPPSARDAFPRWPTDWPDGSAWCGATERECRGAV